MSLNNPESENRPRSKSLFAAATKFIPGGVSRNTIYRHPFPDFADFGIGSKVVDVDGVERIDFSNNMASLIHGHSFQPVVDAVSEQLTRGTAFTMPAEAEVALARLLCERVPWFEKVRFMNSGTEAVMVAIKAARSFTGLPAIAKAEGTYHGTYDFAEIGQNSQPEGWGEVSQPASTPVAQGTPQSTLDEVVVFPFNDIPNTKKLLDENSDRLAAVLIDLVPQRAGLIEATQEFVQFLRDWTGQNEKLLIFDEVINFRMSLTGSAGGYDCHPDLTTLGKIIGGGFPVGALAGTNEVMSVLDPLTNKNLPCPWSGTFAANPVTMTAGKVALDFFDDSRVDAINELGEFARQEISSVIRATGVTACVTGSGSMFRIHPKAKMPVDYRSTWQTDLEREATTRLVRWLYDEGFMLFRTCTAALATVNEPTQIEKFVAALSRGLPKCFA